MGNCNAGLLWQATECKVACTCGAQRRVSDSGFSKVGPWWDPKWEERACIHLFTAYVGNPWKSVAVEIPCESLGKESGGLKIGQDRAN
jgi:hypothetical protein